MTKFEQMPINSGKGLRSKRLALGGGIAAGRSGKTPLVGLGVLGCVAVAVLLIFLLIPERDREPTVRTAHGFATPKPLSALPGEPTTKAMRAEAVEVARDLVQNLPNDANALALAAMVYNELGRSDESMACWRKCLILAPRRADAAAELGRIALKRGEYDKAASVLRRAVELGPRTPGVHHALAYALMFLGEHAEAISHFEKEIKISPTSVRSHYMLGQAREQLGQYEAARRSYETVLKLQPDKKNADYMKNALYGLAIVLTKLGDKTQAAEYRRKYTELSRAILKSDIKTGESFDDHAAMRVVLISAHTNSGSIYAATRRGNDAEGHWRRVFAIDAGDVLSRTALAHLLLQEGRNVSEARRLALTVVALDPSPVSYALLARSHSANGDIALAREAVKRAIAKDPANPRYRQILRMLDGGL